jgi:hypothetical protein
LRNKIVIRLCEAREEELRLGANRICK